MKLSHIVKETRAVTAARNAQTTRGRHGRIRRRKYGTGRNHHLYSVLLAAVALAALAHVHGVAVTRPVPITLGQSVVNLNGPWKFHTGDDATWADPNFDDSTWESVDLTAPPGAHDDDVGLTGYVPGWEARGHRGYSGYAWYRLRVAVVAPAQEALALAGPPAVDSAYQVFVNGQLLGGSGGFSGQTPTVVSIQPRVFALPRSLMGGEQANSALIAFRVWMGPWDLGGPSAGGIHIAPALGETSSIDARYQLQWLQTVRGYIVEVVEAAAFILLAVMACTLIAFDRSKPAYHWLWAALVLTALYRANQAIFFWGQFETVHGFEMISVVLLIPLCLAAWTLAWRAWFRLRGTEWMPIAVGLFTLLYMGVHFLTGSWFHGVFSHWVVVTSAFIATWTRVLFLLLTGLIVYRAIRQRGREAWLALPAVVLISIGLFARELSVLGIQGIWFPFGTGVSRTQFAYAAFDAVLFALLLHRFLFFAHGAGGRGRGTRNTGASAGTDGDSPAKTGQLAWRQGEAFSKKKIEIYNKLLATQPPPPLGCRQHPETSERQ